MSSYPLNRLDGDYDGFLSNLFRLLVYFLSRLWSRERRMCKKVQFILAIFLAQIKWLPWSMTVASLVWVLIYLCKLEQKIFRMICIGCSWRRKRSIRSFFSGTNYYIGGTSRICVFPLFQHIDEFLFFFMNLYLFWVKCFSFWTNIFFLLKLSGLFFFS